MRLLMSALFLVTACAQPVIRKTTPEGTRIEPLPPPAAPKAAAFNKPDVKKRLWVLPVTLPNAMSKELVREATGAPLTRTLTEAANGPDSPFLIDKKQEEAIKDLGLNSATDIAELQRLARGSGADAFLVTKVTRLEVVRKGDDQEGFFKTRTTELQADVDFEFFDSTSGRSLMKSKASDTNVELRSDLSSLMPIETERVPNVAEKLEKVGKGLGQKILAEIAPLSAKVGWSGRVVKAENARVFLNAGKRTGLRMSETLKVIEDPQPVQDPMTGEFVGEVSGRVKATIKIIEFFGVDGSIAVLQSGGAVQVNDRVELF